MFQQSLSRDATHVIDLEDSRAHRASSPEIAEDVPIESHPKRRRGTQTLCRGHAGGLCRFAADGRGGRARGKHGGRCIFCSLEDMAQTTQSSQGRGNVVRLLKQWKSQAPDVYSAACAGEAFPGLPSELRQTLLGSALKEDGATPRRIARRLAVASEELHARAQDARPNDTGLLEPL